MRRFDTMYTGLFITRVTIDFPNVPSNGTVTVDTAAPNTPLGTHIISWAPVSDATSIDDLVITFMTVAVNLVRTVLFNPTGGAIDPDSIDFEFVCGQGNPDIDP